MTVVQGCGGSQPGRWLPSFAFDGFSDGEARYFGFVKQKDATMDEGSQAYYGVVKRRGGRSAAKDRRNL